MKRQILTGLAVAGALTLWVGSSAFASEDPAEAVLQQAESSIDAALETFNETVETADENGTTLPTAGDFQTEVNAIATKACADINAVEIVPPTATPGDTETDNNSADKSDTSDKSDKSDKSDTKSGDSKSND